MLLLCWESSWAITWLMLAIVSHTTGLLDFDELRSIHYGIDILDTPLLLQNDPPEGAVILSSKYGQLYQCTYPPVVPLDLEHRQMEQKVHNLSVTELLNPMKNLPCLLYSKGWWTYEFCYGREVKQYRSEEGKIVGDILFLGHYESEFDFSNKSGKTSYKKKSAERYHSQFYVNGSHCDLTDRPRSTEVRFICQEGHGDYVAGVDERETCSYVVTIHTNKICSHPQFGPPVQMKSMSISCSPLLTEMEYKIYEKDISSHPKAVEDSSQTASLTASGTESSSDLQKLFMESFLSSMQAMLAGQKQETIHVVGDDGDDKQKADEAVSSSVIDGKPVSTGDDEIANAEAASLESHAIHDEVTDEDSEASAVSSSDDNIVDGDSTEVDEDQEFLEEFDEELDNIASTALKRAHLAKYKESIKSSMQAQFSDIVDEARADLVRQGDDSADVDNVDAFKKLAQTLNAILERLENMETESLLDTNQESARSPDGEGAGPDPLTATDTGAAASTDTDTDTSTDTDPDASAGAAGAAGAEDVREDADTVDDTVEQQDDENMEGELSAVDKRADAKGDDTDSSSSSSSSGDETKTDDPTATKSDAHKQPVETQLRQRLEQAGLKTAGRKLEFRILTTGYANNDDGSLLSDDDSPAFGKVIIAIIGGDDAETKETQRHQKLEENYRFKLHKSKDKSTNTVNN